MNGVRLCLTAILLAWGACPAAAQKVIWGSELPRVMVFLDEEGATAAGVLTDFLVDAGFDVVDPAFAKTIAQQETVTRALSGDASAAAALGRDLGAQVLILGSAPAETAPSPIDASLRVATANLDVRALRLDNPRVISAATTAARGLDATDTAARSKALQGVAEQLLYQTSFLGDLLTEWESQGWDDLAYWQEAPPAAPALATQPSSTDSPGTTPTPAPSPAVALAVVHTEIQEEATDVGTRGIGVVAAPKTKAPSAGGRVQVRGIVSTSSAKVTVGSVAAQVRAPTTEEVTRYGLQAGEAIFEAMLSLPPGQDTLRIRAESAGEGILIRPRVAKRWAVVIGISAYESSRITALQYADADARGMYDFLRSPAGGSIPEEQIRLLINEEATAAAIREALFVFLQQAAPEDQVTVYVASHGSPDPRRPSNLYILPYDTDPDAVAATAFPMWDFKTALRRQISAERVVVIADACHSGGTLARDSNPIGGAFADLFDPSRRVTLSAAASHESSLEGEQWGGGHGAFTHTLLQGLGGAADRDGDSNITFTEIALYVEDQVPATTQNRQHPQRAGRGDVVLARKSSGGLP